MAKATGARLGKSVKACLLANLAGWLIGTPLMLMILWLTPVPDHPAFHQSARTFPTMIGPGLLVSTLIMSLFSIPPSALLGLPIQALLQRLRLTDIVSNVLTALIIGFPTGLIWATVLMADKGTLSLSLIMSQFEHALKGDRHLSFFAGYLVFGAITFWLIRRPDLDNKSPHTVSNQPATAP